MPELQEQTSNYTQEEKEAMIKKEIARLRKSYASLGGEKINTVIGLLEEAAFMFVTLKDLKLTINKQGCVSFYQNGENQWGTKKSPEVEIYNTMNKNYQSIIKQLTDLVPKEEKKEASDGFDGFVAVRNG